MRGRTLAEGLGGEGRGEVLLALGGGLQGLSREPGHLCTNSCPELCAPSVWAQHVHYAHRTAGASGWDPSPPGQKAEGVCGTFSLLPGTRVLSFLPAVLFSMGPAKQSTALRSFVPLSFPLL